MQDVVLDQELKEDELKSDLLDSLLECLVVEDHVVAITIDEQYALVLDLGMTSRYDTPLQEIPLSCSSLLQ